MLVIPSKGCLSVKLDDLDINPLLAYSFSCMFPRVITNFIGFFMKRVIQTEMIPNAPMMIIDENYRDMYQ